MQVSVHHMVVARGGARKNHHARKHAVKGGGGGAERHQRVHIRRAVKESRKAVDQKVAFDHHHRPGKEKLQKEKEPWQGFAREKRNCREKGDHMPHRNQHQKRRQHGGND